MDNIDLSHYIEQSRKSGMADDKIREGLFQAGWQHADIEEAFKMAEIPSVKLQIPNNIQSPKSKLPKGVAFILVIASFAVIGYVGTVYYLINYQNLSLWPFETKLEPVPTFTPRSQSATKDPTAGWKVYRNEEYGFEFRYPELNKLNKVLLLDDSPPIIKRIEFQTWLKESSQFITNFAFFVEANPDKLELKEWFAKNVDYKDLLVKNGVFKELSNSGDIKIYRIREAPFIPQEYIEHAGPIQVSAFIVSSDKSYVLSFSIAGQENDLDSYGYNSREKRRQLEDQILSTFKFIK